jgi:hypothetical protein
VAKVDLEAKKVLAAGADGDADKRLDRFIMHTKGANLLWQCVAPDIRFYTFSGLRAQVKIAAKLEYSGEFFSSSLKASFKLSTPTFP